MGIIFDKASGVRPGILDQHVHGALIGTVRHACPECPLGLPDPFCAVCQGAGDVTPEALDRYQHVLLRGVVL
jgi:hypothetical protein